MKAKEKKQEICDKCIQGIDGVATSPVRRRPGGRILCDECQQWENQPPYDYSKFADELRELLCQQAGGRWSHLMAFSGGLDSTAALKLLIEEYGIQPLLVHIDNGFRPDSTIQNINAIQSHYGLDMIVLTRTIVSVIRAEFPPGTLFCGEHCTERWLNPALAEVCDWGGFPYCLTGNEIVRQNSILRPGRPRRVSVIAAHLMTKDGLREFISDLPWKDPGIYGYDTDCAYAGYALDRYFSLTGKWPCLLVKHLSDRIRCGTLDRQTELEKLRRGPNLPSKQRLFVVERIAARANE